MKRVMYSLLAVVLCLGAAQLILAQKGQDKAKKGGKGDAVSPLRCWDCEIDPEPTPTPPPPTCSNPIDDSFFFVAQQYRDFLFREPTGGELADDVAPLNSCLHLGDFACYNTERVKMSRRMWDKPEFRQQSRTFGLPLTEGWELYNNGHFVSLEYWIYLQRAPDSGGQAFWEASLDNCINNSGGDLGQRSQCYNDSINAFLHST